LVKKKDNFIILMKKKQKIYYYLLAKRHVPEEENTHSRANKAQIKKNIKNFFSSLIMSI